MGAGIRRGLGIANGVMAGLFVLSALLQLDDPDAPRWFAIYAAAAAACVARHAHARAWLLAAVVGLVAFVWMAARSAVVLEMKFGDLFGSMKAATPIIEESREFLGLLIVVAWMAVLALAGLRQQRSA
jgi:hypothetical protein